MKTLKVQKQFAFSDPYYRLGMMRQEREEDRIERLNRDAIVEECRKKAKEESKKEN